MNPSILQQPFFQVALPIMVTFVAAIWASSWSQNKRLEEMSRRFDDRFNGLEKRLDSVEVKVGSIDRKLDNFSERIVRLEERNPFISVK